MRIDLIALDLDGTLLDSEDQVSDRNRRAIRSALEQGVRVVLVTGRGVDLPIRLSRELGLNLPVICCHGALTKDFGANKTLSHIPVPLQYAKPMIEFAEHNRLTVGIYHEETFWRLEDSQVFLEDMKRWREVKEFRDIMLGAPTFIRFLGDEAVAAMDREFGDWPLAFRHERWGEFRECAVLNRDASKRTALSRLCADFQIPRDRVLAIGDSDNDVPMLRWAGAGVAMGNAGAAVKEAVSYQTASNDQDGVALAIERLVLRAGDKKPA